MRLQDLRDQWAGESITLLGNGSTQHSKIDGLTFGMNRCGLTFNPDFYLCLDHYVLDNYTQEVHNNIDKAHIAFVPHETTDRFKGIPVIVKRTPQTDDLTEGVYCYGSSMTAAIQLIWWMGFTDVTIDRVDFYAETPLHHYPMKDDSMALLDAKELDRRRQKNLRAHAWIIDYCGFHGVKLTHA